MGYLLFALLLAASAGFINLGLRSRVRYDLSADYRYPFTPDARVSCRMEEGVLVGADPADYRDHSLLLALHIRSGWRGKVRDPHVRLRAGQQERSHYFERGAEGLRFVDLSWAAGSAGPLVIETCFCDCGTDAELLAFANPPLTGNILIVAPHPDDAELAAFGLYSAHPARTTIVTVSAGESVNDLGRQYVPGLDSDRASAVRRKGLTRALDGVTAPLWGGIDPAAVLQLGYFNDSLTRMQQQPETVVPHPADGALRPAEFRRFNAWSLASDSSGVNRWTDLVADFIEVLRRVQPAVIVTTDPELDPHPDHCAATLALREAMAFWGREPETMLYYVTHVRGTDEYPFGPPHCLTGPAPWFTSGGEPRGYFSVPLTAEAQRNKICAMEAMHDLRSTLRVEKVLKRLAQAVVAGRRWPHYGEHGYFRTAVKANEIFLVGRTWKK